MLIRKCLFDNGYEEDRVALLQSAILLGFWFSDAEDRTASWHWTGVAISLAQTLGLHRGLVNQECSRIPMNRQRLWRRIWWVCFFRDRWLSLGMGRPMRINSEDCDVAMPSVEDVMSEARNLPESAFATYLPSDLEDLTSCWLTLIHLSTVLGDILAKVYRPRKAKLPANEIEDLERKVLAVGKTFPTKPQSDLRKLSEKTFQLSKEYVYTVYLLRSFS